MLWITAFVVVLPAWAYGLSTGRLWLALGGLPLAALMIYYSIAKRCCPSCGKAVRAIGRAPAHLHVLRGVVPTGSVSPAGRLTTRCKWTGAASRVPVN